MPPIAPAAESSISLLKCDGLPERTIPTAETAIYNSRPQIIPEIIPLWRRYFPKIKPAEKAPVKSGMSEIILRSRKSDTKKKANPETARTVLKRKIIPETVETSMLSLLLDHILRR